MPNSHGLELRPDRPAFIGIHTRDEDTRVLYVSSGCRQALGYTPESLIDTKAKMFIADSYDNTDYVRMFDSHAGVDDGSEQGNSDDEANAYTWQVNLKNADGVPVFHRSINFKCDNCIIFICIAFPEVPFRSLPELEAQMLDGKMTQMNVTRDRRPAVKAPGRRLPLYYARNSQLKAAFVLEHPSRPAANVQDARRHLNGPLVVFVTGSVSRLVDADPSDLHRYAFLRLVAPEDVLHVSRYFVRLSESSQVQFETFSLLSRPPVIVGDVHISDEENERVVVECLGAAVTDGVTLLLRKIAVMPAPKRDSLGNYVRPPAPTSDAQSGYGSLFDLLS
ncbi:hypothetical protein H4R19_007226, partial [Coemansia spiralis]